QWPRCLPLGQERLQDLPVALSRLDESGIRLLQPGGHEGGRLAGREWLLEDARVGGNSQEGPQRGPGESDELVAGEGRFQPLPAGPVPLRPGVVGVQQEIGVDEDQRCCAPSTLSSRPARESRLKPGRRRPRSRATTLNGGAFPIRRWLASPRRRASFTTSRKVRPERRASPFSLFATSS